MLLISWRENKPVESQIYTIASVDLNIIAVVYITTRHADSKGAWELQRAKARQWIRREQAEDLAKQVALGLQTHYSLETHLEWMEKLLSREVVPELIEGMTSGLFDNWGNTSSA